MAYIPPLVIYLNRKQGIFQSLPTRAGTSTMPSPFLSAWSKLCFAHLHSAGSLGFAVFSGFLGFLGVVGDRG